MKSSIKNNVRNSDLSGSWIKKNSIITLLKRCFSKKTNTTQKYKENKIMALLANAGFTLHGNEKFSQMVINSANQEQLYKGFEALINAGITFNEATQKIYKTVMRKAHSVDKLPQVFYALRVSGIPFQKEFSAIYQAAINNAINAEKMLQALNALKEAGIFFQEGSINLYAAAIDYATHADKFSQAFNELKKAGIPFQDKSIKLYTATIKKAAHADKILLALNALKAAGIPFQEETMPIYQDSINNVDIVDKLLDILSGLKEAGIPFHEDSKKLYAAAINNLDEADTLPQVLNALKEAGIPFQEDSKKLYVTAINNPDAEILIQVLNALKAAKIPFQKETMALYQASIDNVVKVEKLIHILNLLKDEGILFQVKYLKIYTAAINKAAHADKLLLALNVLKAAGISFQEKSLNLYTAAINNALNPDKMLQALNALKAAGISFKEESVNLYVTAIDKATNAHKFSQALNALKEEGLPFNEESVNLYEAAIDKAVNADKLPQVLNTLKKAGIPFQEEYASLYAAAIDNTVNAEKFPQVLNALNEAGIPFQEESLSLYIAAIDKAIDADKLPQTLNALKEAGIPFQKKSKMLYVAAINKSVNAKKLPQVLDALNEAGIIFQEDSTKLYTSAIYSIAYVHKLPLALKTLQESGISFHEKTKWIYQAAIINASHADKLLQTLNMLKEAGIPFQEETMSIYQAAIHNIANADKLPQVFEVLENANITFNAHNKELYASAINKNHKELSKAFLMLKNECIIFQEDSKILYKKVIENINLTKKIQKAFLKFKNAGITFNENNKVLYFEVIKNIEYIDQFYKVFDFLIQSDIRYDKYASYFNTYVLIEHSEMTYFVLKELIEAGYSLEAHETIFLTMLNSLSHQEVHYQTIVDILNKIRTYPPASIDNNTFKTIIDQISNRYNSLTLGPLLKSKSTSKIEELLEKICNTEEVKLTFKDPNDYILALPNEAEINLSLLLKNANLSQLTLSDEVITKLGEKLKRIMSKQREDRYDNFIVKLLPDVQQWVVHLYVGPLHYKNINGFFRAEPLTYNQDHPQICKGNENNCRIAYFILGCLLNDAANKLNYIVDDQPEKLLLDKIASHYKIDIRDYISDEAKFNTLLARSLNEGIIHPHQPELDKMNNIEKIRAFYPPRVLKLDRGEQLNEEVLKRRTANPWMLGSFTSFSSFKEGSPFFHKPGMTRNVVQRSPNEYIYNTNEGEIGIPHGTQVMTSQQVFEGKVKLISTIFRSPSLDPGDHDWTDRALLEATLNNVAIVRPNDSLANSYRIMLAIGVLVNYFAHHAKDEDFKHFSQSITDSELEWLRVAAAFSNNSSEQDSSDRFVSFVKETVLDNSSQAMQERLQQVICDLCDPKYKDVIENGIESGNQHERIERKTRHYYHLILRMAHNLNLAHCLTVDQYKESIKPLFDLAQESPEQMQALNEMIRYMIELNKVHGNRLRCDLQPNGELVDVNIDYQPISLEVSRNWKRLFEITDTVTRPQIKLSFQYDANLSTQTNDSTKNINELPQSRICDALIFRSCKRKADKETQSVAEAFLKGTKLLALPQMQTRAKKHKGTNLLSLTQMQTCAKKNKGTNLLSLPQMQTRTKRHKG